MTEKQLELEGVRRAVPNDFLDDVEVLLGAQTVIERGIVIGLNKSGVHITAAGHSFLTDVLGLLEAATVCVRRKLELDSQPMRLPADQNAAEAAQGE
jgi:hypothetical protein